MSDCSISVDTNPYKKDFALLDQNPDIAYLDSAATTQRPVSVIEAQRRFYDTMNANPLRGLYKHSVEATLAIENAREHIARFIGADNKDEIVFTKNTSESLNLIADSLGSLVLGEGDEIVISIMEHHSNILPWQRIAKRTGARLVWLYPDKEGHISDETIAEAIGPKTKIVSIAHVSNVLGIKTPIEKIAVAAHQNGAYVVVDAAQSLPHLKVNVKELGCDLMAFSAHKILGPMGIGCIWGKSELLDAMPPFLLGGEMIESVTQDGAVWAPVPQKFEAGTQDAAGMYAFDEALTYMDNVGHEALKAREDALMQELMDSLSDLEFVEIIGSEDPKEHIGVVSFNVDGVHPHDVASILDMHGVEIRAGHHCAEPLLTWLGYPSCCRASVAFYNDKQDIERLHDGLASVWSVFNGTR